MRIQRLYILLKIKIARFGSIDRENTTLVDSVADTGGEVQLLTDSTKIRVQLNERTMRSTRFAVLVMKSEDKAKAKWIFKTPLVFSAQEAKGLEYQNSILLNFVSGNSKDILFHYAMVYSDFDCLDRLSELKYRKADRRQTEGKSIFHKYYGANPSLANLSKHELDSTNLYNKKLFKRIYTGGFYELNPDLAIWVNDQWISVYDIMQAQEVKVPAKEEEVAFIEAYRKQLREERRRRRERGLLLDLIPFQIFSVSFDPNDLIIITFHDTNAKGR